MSKWRFDISFTKFAKSENFLEREAEEQRMPIQTY